MRIHVPAFCMYSCMRKQRTVPLLPKSDISNLKQSSVVVSDLIGNSEDRFVSVT